MKNILKNNKWKIYCYLELYIEISRSYHLKNEYQIDLTLMKPNGDEDEENLQIWFLHLICSALDWKIYAENLLL